MPKPIPPTTDADEIETLASELARLWVTRHPDEGTASSENGLLPIVERYCHAWRSTVPEAVARDERWPLKQWGVYHLVGADGAPFYIGMTGSPRRRLGQHRREFGDRIHRIDWFQHGSRVAAYDAESEHIAEHRPRMNIAKTGRSVGTR